MADAVHSPSTASPGALGTAEESGGIGITGRSVQVHDYRGKQELSPAEEEELHRLELGDAKEREDARIAAIQAKYSIAHENQARTQLPSGASFPLVGLGTWKSDKGDAGRAVQAAVHAGYRAIDCARIYGNENEIGAALAEVLAEGVVKREQLFITGKLWNSDHAPERVEAACRQTLADLQLQYLDLFLIHWPFTGLPGPQLSPPYIDTWRAMEGLVSKGLVRDIGVSNMSRRKIQELLDAGVTLKPAVNQVEAHPYFCNDALLQYCTAQGIHLTAYSPLGSPDSADIMGRDKAIQGPMQDATVKAIADRLGQSCAQVLIRWAVQRGTSVLPKSTHPGRITANLDVFSWSLSAEDFAALSSLSTQRRMVAGGMWVNPQGPYRSLQELWDEDEGAGQQLAE